MNGTKPATAKRPLRERLVWPGMVFFLIGMSMTTVTTTIILATNDRAFAVEDDYYAKAIAWDETAAERRASDKLGWFAACDLSSELDLSGHRAVTVMLTDSQDAPVDVSSLRVYAFHHARRSEPIEFGMVRVAPGRYAAGAPMTRPGLWQLRIRGERGGDLFLTTADLSTQIEASEFQ